MQDGQQREAASFPEALEGVCGELKTSGQWVWVPRVRWARQAVVALGLS